MLNMLRDSLKQSMWPKWILLAVAGADRHLGQRVRWGGTIIAVHNKEGTTEIEVLAESRLNPDRPRVHLAYASLPLFA